MALFLQPSTFFRLSWLWVLGAGLASCHAVQEEDLAGYWEFFGRANESLHFLYFKKDSVYLEGNYGFPQRGTFEIEGNEIKIKTTSDLQTSIAFQSLSDDTLRLTDTSQMIRFPETILDTFSTFSLLDLPSTDTLKKQGLLSPSIFYKNEQGKRILRLGSKSASFDDIPLFTMRSHHRSPKQILLFLDKDISLADLDTLHNYLLLDHISRISLVVRLRDFQKYDVFHYRIFGWKEDMDRFKENVNTVLPPPPTAFPSRIHYLRQKASLLTIGSAADLQKILAMKPPEQYLVSFNAGLPVSTYFFLKMELYRHAKAKKIQFRTEVYYPQGEPDIFDPRNAPLENQEQ